MNVSPSHSFDRLWVRLQMVGALKKLSAAAKAPKAAHLGAKPPPDKPLVSRGFAKVTKRDKEPLRVAAGLSGIWRQVK